MKNLGYLLLAVGFIASAYVASLDPQVIVWAYFVPAIAVGVVGLVLVKRSQKHSSQNSEVLDTNRDVLTQSLDRVVQNLSDLKQRKVEIPTYKMRFEIDRLFRDDLRSFIDARESMIHLYGLQSYADVMSAFAAGERYINRIWSASTDGYQDEVLNYVDKADKQFIQAQAKLREVMQANPVAQSSIS